MIVKINGVLQKANEMTMDPSLFPDSEMMIRTLPHYMFPMLPKDSMSFQTIDFLHNTGFEISKVLIELCSTSIAG